MPKSLRIGVLLCALLISIAPAFATGSLGSHSRSTRSYSSHSYRNQSSGSRRSHASTGRSHHRRYRTRSPRASAYGVQRDSHGRIKRSAAAKDALRV
jgi:hypothetical protein